MQSCVLVYVRYMKSFTIIAATGFIMTKMETRYRIVLFKNGKQ